MGRAHLLSPEEHKGQSSTYNTHFLITTIKGESINPVNLTS